MLRGSRGSLLLGASSVLVAAVSCHQPQPRRPNVVIVVLDTVRQDRLSCYGYPRRSSPVIDALARESTMYTEAYSVSSWTSPAHASLFTGLYPIAHGTSQEDWRLDDDLLTMAEILQGSGYQTIGIVQNPMLSTALRFDQGFVEYHETWKAGASGKPGVLPSIQASLDRVPRDAPFFLFVNLLAAHSPYTSAPRFRDTFVSDPTIDIVANHWKEFYRGLRTFSKAELRHLNELYDAEILFVDDMVGRIVQELRAADAWEDTIFIVTSDHGENIGDHGHVDHVFSLYESTVRIPLLIRYPARFEPGSVDVAPAQLTDILPTVLPILGLDAERELQGVDLLDVDARRGRTVFCEYYRPFQAFSGFRQPGATRELARFDRHLAVVIRDGSKLIWSSDGKHELYDLRSDPGETVNRVGLASHAEAERSLLAELARLGRRFERDRVDGRERGTDPYDQLDDETLERLRSLGYLE